MLVSLHAAFIVALLALLPAQAGERDKLDACKAKVDRAAQSQAAGATDDVELAHCRQIIREWTLRDSRMSVDENGRPLR